MYTQVFIEDGNKDIIPDSGGLINFHKRRALAEIIKDIQQHRFDSTLFPLSFKKLVTLNVTSYSFSR